MHRYLVIPVPCGTEGDLSDLRLRSTAAGETSGDRMLRKWDFLISGSKAAPQAGGQIFFDLNATHDGKYYTPDIPEVFVRHEAALERGNVLLLSGR